MKLVVYVSLSLYGVCCLGFPVVMVFVTIKDCSYKTHCFRETIPAYLNFGHRHMFFLYPKKLSYLSSNAYIMKIRVRLLGNA